MRCLRELSTVRRSVSNAFGWMVKIFKRRKRYLFDVSLSLPVIANKTQAFYKEAVLWKNLNHVNILPLLGVTIEPLQLVSKWVSGGHMREYIKKYPDADRRRLVRVPFVVAVRRIIPPPAGRRRSRAPLPSLLQCDTW